MNYQEFRAFRETAIAGRPLLRLDCMNPVKALSGTFGKELRCRGDSPGPWQEDGVIHLWEDVVLGGTPREGYATALTRGVRQALDDIFEACAPTGRTVWVPEDVYPQYLELARNRRVKTRLFATLGKPELRTFDEADERAVLLLPQPLAPAGRSLNTVEIRGLASWLRESPQRVLVLDCVYSLVLPLGEWLRPLLDTSQVLVLHSMSKGWLSPGLGAALLPSRRTLLGPLAFSPPGREALETGGALLSHSPALPRQIEAVLGERWRRLTPIIKTGFPSWQPPETGYFSTLPASCAELATNFGWLAIPASVFGSSLGGLSVITCLYYDARAVLP